MVPGLNTLKKGVALALFTAGLAFSTPGCSGEKQDPFAGYLAAPKIQNQVLKKEIKSRTEKMQERLDEIQTKEDMERYLNSSAVFFDVNNYSADPEVEEEIKSEMSRPDIIGKKSLKPKGYQDYRGGIQRTPIENMKQVSKTLSDLGMDNSMWIGSLEGRTMGQKSSRYCGNTSEEAKKTCYDLLDRLFDEFRDTCSMDRSNGSSVNFNYSGFTERRNQILKQAGAKTFRPWICEAHYGASKLPRSHSLY